MFINPCGVECVDLTLVNNAPSSSIKQQQQKQLEEQQRQLELQQELEEEERQKQDALDTQREKPTAAYEQNSADFDDEDDDDYYDDDDDYDDDFGDDEDDDDDEDEDSEESTQNLGHSWDGGEDHNLDRYDYLNKGQESYNPYYDNTTQWTAKEEAQGNREEANKASKLADDTNTAGAHKVAAAAHKKAADSYHVIQDMKAAEYHLSLAHQHEGLATELMLASGGYGPQDRGGYEEPLRFAKRPMTDETYNGRQGPRPGARKRPRASKAQIGRSGVDVLKLFEEAPVVEGTRNQETIGKGTPQRKIPNRWLTAAKRADIASLYALVESRAAQSMNDRGKPVPIHHLEKALDDSLHSRLYAHGGPGYEAPKPIQEGIEGHLRAAQAHKDLAHFHHEAATTAKEPLAHQRAREQNLTAARLHRVAAIYAAKKHKRVTAEPNENPYSANEAHYTINDDYWFDAAKAAREATKKAARASSLLQRKPGEKKKLDWGSDPGIFHSAEAMNAALRILQGMSGDVHKGVIENHKAAVKYHAAEARKGDKDVYYHRSAASHHLNAARAHALALDRYLKSKKSQTRNQEEESRGEALSRHADAIGKFAEKINTPRSHAIAALTHREASKELYREKKPKQAVYHARKDAYHTDMASKPEVKANFIKRMESTFNSEKELEALAENVFTSNVSTARKESYLSDEDKRYGVRAKRELEETAQNPASWVKDEDKWEKAKEAASKEYDKGSGAYWPVVTHIYRKMGGRIKKGSTHNAAPRESFAHPPKVEHPLVETMNRLGQTFKPILEKHLEPEQYKGLFSKHLAAAYASHLATKSDTPETHLDALRKNNEAHNAFHAAIASAPHLEKGLSAMAAIHKKAAVTHLPKAREITENMNDNLDNLLHDWNIVNNSAVSVQKGKKLSPHDFAYVPDPNKPSTWKLRIDDPHHVGGAIAAIGKGFRGQKVAIPAQHKAAVKEKILSAWKKFHKGEAPPKVLTNEGEMYTENDRSTKHHEKALKAAKKARDTSEKAAAPSDHSIDAHEASKRAHRLHRPDSNLAKEAHQRAADAHNRAARLHDDMAEDDPDECDIHELAARHHREAKSHHEDAMNQTTHNCEKCGNSLNEATLNAKKLHKMSDGELEQHHKEVLAEKNRRDMNNFMGLTYMNPAEETPSSAAGSAYEGMDLDDIDWDAELEGLGLSHNTSTNTTTNRQDPNPENSDWFKNMPRQYQEAVRNAANIVNRERGVLLQQLTANMNEQQKHYTLQKFKDWPIEDLRQMVGVFGNPVANDTPPPPLGPIYLGANSPGEVLSNQQTNNSGEDATLPLPTMSYSKDSPSQSQTV